MITYKFLKRLIANLFVIAFGFATGSVGAQSWTASTSPPNSCVGSVCMCPQTWTYGYSNTYGENCQTAGDIASNDGCWNPSTGKCYTCGDGGTILLSYAESGYAITACFGGSDGQSNYSGMGPSPSGISCTSNSDCIPWNNGATSGGYSQSSSSDQRLKRDITPVAVTDSGIQLYSFKYLWSDQVYVGVMAQELLNNPQWKDAVITKQNGFYAVNYSKLGFEMMTLEQYQQHNAVALVK